MIRKNILLGVTGGIASYKSAELVRLLRKSGFEVQVVMTAAAQEFVTPLLMTTLSGNATHYKLFEHDTEAAMHHISLARWAETILIAPATANCIAKLAHGICDDLLSTLCLAKADNVPLVIAPAMNTQMWHAEATQHNLQILRDRGALVLGPTDGGQACGEVGVGRMLEPDEILKLLNERHRENGELQGCRMVITAGPTREYLDPVRFISNASSGKMGYALAASAAAAGATVTLISGPTALAKPNNVNAVDVVSSDEMFEAVISRVKDCDIFVSVAAVTDYCFEATTEHKIKKTEDLRICLKQNKDILATVAALPSPPITVGFAAETENVLANAAKKLKDKRLDMIVANKVGHNLGFDENENHLFVLSKNQKEPIELGPASKAALADQLIQVIAKAWQPTAKMSSL